MAGARGPRSAGHNGETVHDHGRGPCSDTAPLPAEASSGAPVATAAEADQKSTPGRETDERGLGSAAQAVARATLWVVLFVTLLDHTIVSAALGDIQSSRHASAPSLEWVENG
jgi:hypothetical protein